jgi:hypothetical protein
MYTPAALLLDCFMPGVLSNAKLTEASTDDKNIELLIVSVWAGLGCMAIRMISKVSAELAGLGLSVAKSSHSGAGVDCQFSAKDN